MDLWVQYEVEGGEVEMGGTPLKPAYKDKRGCKAAMRYWNSPKAFVETDDLLGYAYKSYRTKRPAYTFFVRIEAPDRPPVPKLNEYISRSAGKSKRKGDTK